MARVAKSIGEKGLTSNSSVRKRTKTGCLTCRKRRIKCGEEKPVCSNCVRAKRKCEGYSQRSVITIDPEDLEAGESSPSPIRPTATIHNDNPVRAWRLCFIIIALGVLSTAASLSLALWWSYTRNDVSGGFTIAAYVVAVCGIPIASVQMRHNSSCKCWDKAVSDEVVDAHAGED